MRRSPGTGSVRHLDGDRYLLRVVLADGRRPSKVVRAESDEDASRQLDALVAVLSQGGSLSPGGITLRGWLETWLGRQAGGRSWGTYDNRVRNQLHEAPFIDDLLVNLRSSDIRDWLRKQLAAHADATVQGALAVLKMALREACEDDIIATNPALAVRLPKAARRPRAEARAPLTREELEAVVASQLPAADRALILAAAFGGLRSGEAHALPLERITDEGEAVLLDIRFGGYGGAPTKSGKPRTVVLVGAAAEALREHLQSVPRDRARNPELLAFPGRGGGRRRLSHASKWLRFRLGLVGVKSRPRFHDLRHTAATALREGWLGEAVPVEQIQVLLGHADRRQTEAYTGAAVSLMLATMRRVHAAAKETGRKLEEAGRSESPANPARTARSGRRRPCSPAPPVVPQGSALPLPSRFPPELVARARELVEGTASGRVGPADWWRWLGEVEAAEPPTPYRRAREAREIGGEHLVRRALEIARDIVKDAPAVKEPRRDRR